jgi:tetratricopeptide (TPR) repeat protein
MLMPEAHVVLAQREAAAVPVPVPPRPEEGFVVDRPIARAERVIRPAAFKAADPARLAQMIETGDRMFRVRNFVRAESWYQQALAADPESVRVRLRLAQLAVERGQYRQAANWLQEAQDIQPRWLDRADDVQVLYKEPVEFGRLIGRIETHLQAHPEDRDAWLLLGAQYQLAGRSKQASDIFLRLTDRRPDALLQAFLDTSAGVRR